MLMAASLGLLPRTVNNKNDHQLVSNHIVVQVGQSMFTVIIMESNTVINK